MSPAELHTPEPEAPPPRRRPLRLLILGGVVLALAAMAGAAYLARRDLARNAITGWLEERGVPAEIEVERFGPTGAVAKIRAGTPGDPQFAVERAEIEYGLLGLWSGDPFGVEVKRVRLVRPVLRGAWRDGKLTFGPLDPLIEELRRRPPRPDRAKPMVLVEDGLVGLSTQYGLLRLRGDARVEDNKLMSLDGRLAPAAAKFGEVEMAVRGGEVRLRTRADRVSFSLGAILGEARGEHLQLRESFLRLDGEGPYPDLEKRIGDGALALTLTGGARDLTWEGRRFQGAEFNARFNGRSTGWVDTLAIGGRGGLEAKATEVSAEGATLRNAALTAETPTLSWTRQGPDRVAAQGRLSARIGELVQGDLRLQGVSGDFRGKASGGVEQPARLHLTGQLAAANGAWTALGPVQAADDPGVAALKRALGRFTLRAPAVSLDGGGENLVVALGAPARVTAASGGEFVVTPRAGAPVYEGGQGAFVLRASGGAMPQVDLSVDRYALRPGGFDAQGRGRLDGDFLLFREAQLQLAGGLAARNGAFTLTARGCAPLSAGRLELGENDVHAVTGQVCAVRAPLLTWKDEAWRVRASLTGGAAQARFLDLRFDEAAGAIDVAGQGGPLTVKADIASARVIDALEPRRFNPVRMSGQANAARGRWDGQFDIVTPAGLPLGRANLQHEEATERGSFTLDTGEMTFAEGGLQPVDLSPIARLIASPAEGQARFVGGFAWSPRGEASSGRLSIARLDFRGPIGPVKGLAGEIELTSLDPLATAPGQVLTAERIEAFAPLTEVRAVGRIEDELLHVASAEAVAGRGKLSFEPMAIPFDETAAWSGAMRLDDVQLSDIVEASPLAEQVDLTAKVDGRVPFNVTPPNVRISGGEIHAVEPGRLAIRREALTSVAAEGGAPEAPPNMTVDFAYQAMENLAFDRLAAEIDSRPNGRLGVMFYITGRHDPPKPQELRLGWWELFQQKFMERTHPLPSGVEVNLALDVSLNFDQLMADWAEYQSLIDRQSRGSAEVHRTPRN